MTNTPSQCNKYYVSRILNTSFKTIMTQRLFECEHVLNRVTILKLNTFKAKTVKFTSLDPGWAALLVNRLLPYSQIRQ